MRGFRCWAEGFWILYWGVFGVELRDFGCWIGGVLVLNWGRLCGIEEYSNRTFCFHFKTKFWIFYLISEPKILRNNRLLKNMRTQKKKPLTPSEVKMMTSYGTFFWVFYSSIPKTVKTNLFPTSFVALKVKNCACFIELIVFVRSTSSAFSY